MPAIAPVEASVLSELLPNALDWNHGLELVRLACSAHIRWSFARLGEWAHQLSIPLDLRLRNLPKTHQQRLILAPRFSYWLQKPVSAEDGQHIANAIEFEQQLALEARSLPEGRWSALGDLCPPNYTAPTIAHIVVDARSPFSLYGYPDQYGDVTPHSVGELPLIVARIDECLARIEQQCPAAASTVKASIQVLSLITTPNAPELTSSMSTRKIIGRMSLTNAHTDKWSHHRLVNAIVHESIHSLIYKLELLHPLYEDDAAAWTLKVTSPWSGRTLFLHSFVHACFVWYGLWNYWNLTPVHDEESLEFRLKAERGFEGAKLLDALPDASRACIRLEVQTAIGLMDDRVNAHR